MGYKTPERVESRLLYIETFRFSIPICQYRALFESIAMALDIDIKKLIPHRDQMKIIDNVVSVADDVAVTSATVTDQWPLFNGRGVSSLVVIELAAQTSAVSIGWKTLMETGESGGRGWLVGIRKARFFWETIPVGAEILTRAEISFSLDNYTEIQGTAEVNGEVVGEVGLQVMREEAS